MNGSSRNVKTEAHLEKQMSVKRKNKDQGWKEKHQERTKAAPMPTISKLRTVRIIFRGDSENRPLLRKSQKTPLRPSGKINI